MLRRSLRQLLGQKLRRPRLRNFERLEAISRRPALYSLNEGNSVIIRPAWIAVAILFAFAWTLQPAADARSKPMSVDSDLVPAVHSVGNPGLLDLPEGDVCGAGGCTGRPLGLGGRLNPLKLMHNKKPLRRLLFRKVR